MAQTVKIYASLYVFGAEKEQVAFSLPQEGQALVDLLNKPMQPGHKYRLSETNFMGFDSEGVRAAVQNGEFAKAAELLAKIQKELEAEYA